VIRSIILYIVLSAENLKTLDATHLEHLIERVNEYWTDNIAVKNSLSRLNYSVEFKRSAFINKQLKKLDSLIDSVFENFLFIAIYWMYFSFFTCEIKCDVATLDIVDRQNAHSMIVIIRAFVQLYKAVKCEKELHQKILAFLILHDHRSMRIYDHYIIIEKDKIIFYHYFIHTFDFITLNKKNKWMMYKFTKNIYNTWMLIHHKRICSAINDLSSDIDFNLSQSASFLQSESQSSQQSNVKFTLMNEDDSSLQEVTSIILFTQTIERASKKSRNQRAARQQRWNVERRSANFKQF